uniref:Uncharacterized protein n=1 Tax=Brassica campestris TaxID=3711 RepID=M4E404_BRACM
MYMHVRKRSSNRVGEAANQHEKNIWLREATKLVLMCTYLMLAIHGFFQEAVEQRALITSEEGSPVQFGDVDYKVHGLDFVFAGKDTRFSEHQQQIQCQELSESCVWWTKRIRCYLSSKK